MTKPPLKIILAAPRGFCAGVDRAITIVKKTLKKYGAPVYVRHEIVHNAFVVKDLQSQGVIFVDSLQHVPHGMPVIFSAHGVAKSVKSKAASYNMIHLDATCPLVEKVHRSVERNFARGYTTILIGHKDHPEVIGTMGQLPNGAIVLVQSVEDVKKLDISHKTPLCWSTQTTLSTRETKNIIQALKKKFPQIKGPKGGDICYATTNRQEAVSSIARIADVIFVLGAPNSSNSKRLVEMGIEEGCKRSILIQSFKQINWRHLENAKTLGITAGASAPEILVQEVIAACKKRFTVEVTEMVETLENLSFPLPRQLKEV